MDPLFSLNPELAWRVIDGEVVILRIKTTTYYSLDPVGSFIWRSMEQKPLPRSELIDLIVAEYDVSRETAAADLDELFADLVREELLLASPPSDRSEAA
ncbi:MAG: PqqD family protein [Candidatus Hydrogenedentota bacterium]